MKMKLIKKIHMVGIFALICMFLLGMGGCKKIDVPLASININNECGLAIDLFIDGEFQFSVEYEDTRLIENLNDGTYLFEARRTGTGEFVAQESIFVRINAIYTWTILSSASIKITNNYGETLSIYNGDINLGSVADQSNATVDNVPYGDQKLEAKTSDETIVATITISVLFDNTYEWTINK